MTGPTLIVTTARQPGAVAILQLHGQGARDLVRQITGRARCEIGRVYLADFAGIDEGLAVCLADDWAQLMPHAGPRVVDKLVEHLLHHGAARGEVDNRALYPEADSAIEADMLAALAMSPSPAAIDLLLAQPRLWRQSIRRPPSPIRHLDHLLSPPTVVVAGAPNAGKSTLANAILGRTANLVSDLPGATRDWVGSLAEIAGVAVHWIDTPGIPPEAPEAPEPGDAVEREAIRLASRVIERADVLIAMREPDGAYPPLPRVPDVCVVNKIDASPPLAASRDPRTTDGLAKPQAADELHISALRRINLDALQHRVLRALGLHDVAPDTLWAFSPTLKRYASGEAVDLPAYVAAR